MTKYTLFRKGKNKYYVIHNMTGLKHSKNPLKYHMARAQLRALNSIAKNKSLSIYDIDGGSFLDSLKSGLKNVYGRVKGFVTGVRDDYQPYVRKLLDEIKGNKIIKLVVIREPIKEAVNMLVNVITVNKVNEFKKDVGVDDLFHLYMIATLDNGKLIRIEKNAEIDIKEVNSIPNVNQLNMLNIVITSNLSVNELLNNTRQKIGDRLFFDYDGIKNNCQDFLYNILYMNGFEASNPTMKSFIKQDLVKLSNNLSQTSKKIMNTLTNLGKRAQIIIGGAGF